MTNYVCMYQQYLANLAGDCCTNCGQQHYGTVPYITPPSGCYPSRPCMLCSPYEDQNIFVLLDAGLPTTQDFNGNSNLATPNNAQPYSRSYSLASSHETNRSNRRTSLAEEETLQNSVSVSRASSDDQRSHVISCKTNRTQNVEPLYDGNVFGILIDQLSTPLIQQQYPQSLGNIDQQSDVEQEESNVWLNGSISTNPRGKFGAVEHPLQQQAGELAKMRHYQEMELRLLEIQEPTVQLRDHIDSVMVKQQVEQLRLQEKHRQQLDRCNRFPGRWKENRPGDGADGHLWLKSTSAACKKYYCSSCVTDDGTNEHNEITNSGDVNKVRTIPLIFDSFGQTKSAPTVLTTKPFVSDFLSSPADTLAIDRQRHVNTTKRNAAFQREFAEGQRIADAMADITFKYRQGIIVQAAQQRMEARYRNYTAALQWEEEDYSQAINIAEARRRRQDREAIADAECQLELKKTTWYHELQEIQADNRRRYAEDATAKETVQDHENLTALQDVPNQLKAEEQAFEAQKRKLLQDAVDNKNRQYGPIETATFSQLINLDPLEHTKRLRVALAKQQKASRCCLSVKPSASKRGKTKEEIEFNKALDAQIERARRRCGKSSRRRSMTRERLEAIRKSREKLKGAAKMKKNEEIERSGKRSSDNGDGRSI